MKRILVLPTSIKNIKLLLKIKSDYKLKKVHVAQL